MRKFDRYKSMFLYCTCVVSFLHFELTDSFVGIENAPVAINLLWFGGSLTLQNKRVALARLTLHTRLIHDHEQKTKGPKSNN